MEVGSQAVIAGTHRLQTAKKPRKKGQRKIVPSQYEDMVNMTDGISVKEIHIARQSKSLEQSKKKYININGNACVSTILGIT